MQPLNENPVAAFLRRQNPMILDGGLATTLEARGHDLRDPLWSARVLIDAQDAIRRVHTDFLAAGADCIISSTYQASFAGFRAREMGGQAAAKLMLRSVDLAVEARDAFWSHSRNQRGRQRPLVAASIGPYGAYLADGSEYSGNYAVADDQLLEFHRRRWHVLAESRADLLACETIPSHREAAVLRQLMRETPGRWVWMSFSCRDGSQLCDGSPLVDAARACDAEPTVAAVGINCTAPRWIAPLIDAARSGTTKPVFVYPNSGERYDAELGEWSADTTSGDWGEQPIQWSLQGAVGIGGCCRVGPAQIARIRKQLLSR